MHLRLAQVEVDSTTFSICFNCIVHSGRRYRLQVKGNTQPDKAGSAEVISAWSVGPCDAYIDATVRDLTGGNNERAGFGKWGDFDNFGQWHDSTW